MFRKATECNVWAMASSQFRTLKRGQWVYCCPPGAEEHHRPSRWFGVSRGGSLWASHWQGKGGHAQFDAWCALAKAGNDPCPR